MNIIAIFLSGAVTALVTRAMFVKNSSTNDTPVKVNTGDIDFMDLTEKIDSLSDLKEQLLEIENMITEIESAEQNERQIALNLSMPTADNQYSFLVNNRCNAVLELLYSERKKLRSSIISVIEKIQIRSTKNVRKTSPENTDRGVA